jgi:hypothetical protein
LVVAATMWRVEDACDDLDLYTPLSPVVCTTRRNGALRRGDRLLIADSKHVYSPAKGIARLEHGVLACLDLAGKRPDCTTGLWDHLAADTRSERDALPWYADETEVLPLEADGADIGAASGALAASCRTAGVELVDVRARAVFPQRFNRLTDAADSKGRVNSDASLGLVRALIDQVAGGEVYVVCDKHGGRNRYAALLQSHFPESWIEIGGEGRQRSTYHWTYNDLPIEARFQVGAERYLPVALASMTAKYLRELAMRAFNRYWCRQVAGLRPTAGYPVDARRFKREIAEAQAALGISDDVLWRNR